MKNTLMMKNGNNLLPNYPGLFITKTKEVLDKLPTEEINLYLNIEEGGE